MNRLDAMTAFVRVAELQSFTAAAASAPGDSSAAFLAFVSASVACRRVSKLARVWLQAGPALGMSGLLLPWNGVQLSAAAGAIPSLRTARRRSATD